MFEQQQQPQQESQPQQQVSNQNRLSSDWFYSSVILANRLDIGEHAGITGFQMGQPKSSNQQPSPCNNLMDPELLRTYQYTHTSNDVYSSSVTTASTASSSSSLITSPFQTLDPEAIVLNDKSVQVLDMRSNVPVGVASNRKHPSPGIPTSETLRKLVCTDFTTSAADSSSMNTANDMMMQTQRHSGNNQHVATVVNTDKSRITTCSSIDDDSSYSYSNKSKDDDDDDDDFQAQQARIEDDDGGDGNDEDSGGDDEEEEEAPPNVLYSHSTTNSSDKMKWDCGARWPSAKRTGMPTSSSSSSSSSHILLLDVHEESGKFLDSSSTTGAATDITSSGTGMMMMMVDSSSVVMDIDSEFSGSSNRKLIRENEYSSTVEVDKEKMKSNMVVTHDENSEGIAISKAKVQLQDKCNFTDAIAVTAIGAASAARSTQPSSTMVVVPQQRSSSSVEGSLPCGSSSSIKVPIKKRLIHSSSAASVPLPFSSSTTTTNSSPNIPSKTAVAILPEHQQHLPTTVVSPVTTVTTDSAFSSCSQMTATAGLTSTVVSEDSTRPPEATYPKPLTSNDMYGCMSSNGRIVRNLPNADIPMTVANSLSEAELIGLLCQNVCDIEHIVAQQRIASSGTASASLQLPPLVSLCNGDQQPQASCATSMIVPDHEQQRHDVLGERRRSGTIENGDIRRFHPYATTATTTTTVTATTSCRSSSITVWSPSVPSRADLKQKHLRSLAPVLYDLLSDDCESENCQETTDPMDYSILKSYVEPSMDSYFRSLSLLAATASLPLVNNKFDHLPLNYIDYFALQQYNLLLGSAPVTCSDLLKLAQSANLLYGATVTTPASNPGVALPDTVAFTNEIDQRSAANIMNGSCSQPSQQQAMLIVDNEPSR